MTAEEYFAKRNGGKTPRELTADGEMISPIWASILMRDFAKQNLRDELLKFNSWMCGKQYDGVIPLIETCIDEYLKQKGLPL
jgi:hypothetical protein